MALCVMGYLVGYLLMVASKSALSLDVILKLDCGL